MTSRTQHIMPGASDDGTRRLQFPCALQALRAPQLHSVCLESTGLARMRGRKADACERWESRMAAPPSPPGDSVH